ncbi:MAG: hypothetical protein NZL99_02340, partial [Burkholderiaceae bacterium]|nr:hypothetical protein [Burkholderiaceae bacterium]
LLSGVLLLRPPPAPPAKSLVVLPVTLLPGSAPETALAESLTVELTNAVTRLYNVVVPARAAAARAAREPYDLKAIGRALNVRYALEVALAADGERVRVLAQLSRTDNGTQLWSQSLEAERGEDNLALDVVGRIADSLRLQLRVAELRRLAHVEEAAADAYTLALRARALLPTTEDARGMQEVRRLYELALARDAAHPPALAGLGLTLAVLAEDSEDEREIAELMQRAHRLSAQALALAPNDAEAWVVRAGVLMRAQQSTAAAEAIERAIALNPYLSEAYAVRGQLRINAGRIEEALQAVERGIRLNPVADTVGIQQNVRCRALLYLGRYPEAIDACHRATTFAPEWPDYMLLAAAAAMAGDLARAAAARDELLRRAPSFRIGWLHEFNTDIAERTRQARERHLVAGLRRLGLPD